MSFKAIRLESGSGLAATFVPEAGMIGVSLTDDREELLGQRGGLERYVESGKTMGIPLLHPWANRLAADRYEFEGKTVEIAADAAGVRRDENGLPIHGTLAASPDWRVEDASTGDRLEWAGLKATLDFERPELLATFPFPHRITIEVTLAGAGLAVTTTIEPTGDLAVPLAFGFHPYLSLPGTDRARWAIDLPAMTALGLDSRGIPDGSRRPFPATTEHLGATSWDRAFDGVEPGAVFAVADETRMLAVRFDEGYPAAQVFAPAAENVVCFEPMKAPTNALVSGEGLRSVAPGERDVSRFTISVSAISRKEVERRTKPRFRIDPDRPATEVRRVARERARTALGHLRDAAPEDRGRAIHDARKDMKKMRAVLRLVRGGLSRQTFREENRRYRDAARLLSGSRDADVMIRTVESLAADYPADAVPLGPLLEELRARRDRDAGEDGRLRARMDEAAKAIEDGAGLIEGWSLDRADWDLFERGLRRTYRDGRRAMNACEADPSADAFHEWRKRVKDLWYQLRLLRSAWSVPLKAQAAETGRLGELLGDHNDLAVLIGELDARPAGGPDYAALREAAADRQAELLGEAVPLGHRIFAESPAEFTKRIGAYWNA